MSVPDPAMHNVVRWRCADLRAEVARRWSIDVHESTIGAWLGKLGLTRLEPRPVHPKKDPDAEATFKKTSPAWCAQHSTAPRRARPYKSGIRMRRGSVSKGRTPRSGHRSARGRCWCATIATTLAGRSRCLCWAGCLNCCLPPGATHRAAFCCQCPSGLVRRQAAAALPAAGSGDLPPMVRSPSRRWVGVGRLRSWSAPRRFPLIRHGGRYSGRRPVRGFTG